jgi:TolB-like protein
VEGVAAAIQKGATAKDWGKVGEEIGRRFGQVIEQAVVAGKPLVAAPFPTDPEDAAVSQFAQAAFSKCYGQLILARPNEVTVSPELPADHTDSAFAALGRKLGVGFVLGARLTKATDGARSLAIRLIQSDGGAVAWSGDFPIAGGDADEVGTKIAEAILPFLPPKK